MRISVILYGLYLIFLPGGRLNQQPSGQSASTRCVLHPFSLSLCLSLIFHNAVFLCVIFIRDKVRQVGLT